MVVRNEVVYIDDREDSRETFLPYIQRAFGDEVQVVGLEPGPTIQDTIKILSENWKIGTVITDERLNEGGGANFLGQELIESLRSIYPKLPIYILTAYDKNVINDLDAPEMILSKGDLIKEGDLYKSFARRARRYIGNFDDIMSERNREYTELIRKHISGDITTDETDRLLKLESELIKPVAYEEVIDPKLHEKLVEQEKRLEEINKLLDN